MMEDWHECFAELDRIIAEPGQPIISARPLQAAEVAALFEGALTKLGNGNQDYLGRWLKQLQKVQSEFVSDAHREALVADLKDRVLNRLGNSVGINAHALEDPFSEKVHKERLWKKLRLPDTIAEDEQEDGDFAACENVPDVNIQQANTC